MAKKIKAPVLGSADIGTASQLEGLKVYFGNSVDEVQRGAFIGILQDVHAGYPKSLFPFVVAAERPGLGTSCYSFIAPYAPVDEEQELEPCLSSIAPLVPGSVFARDSAKNSCYRPFRTEKEYTESEYMTKFSFWKFRMMKDVDGKNIPVMVGARIAAWESVSGLLTKIIFTYPAEDGVLRSFTPLELFKLWDSGSLVCLVNKNFDPEIPFGIRK